MSGRAVTVGRAVNVAVSRLLVLLLSLPVHAWRLVVSPLLGPRCRYQPSCSRYALDALRAHGPIQGTILACWRVLRCHPWAAGGLDPVDEQRLFRRRLQ